jgi:hypothetical protein
MRKFLLLSLVVVMLTLSACGPAMAPKTGAKTESGDVFMLALPRLEIAFDKVGNPVVLGMKLSDVGLMLGQDLSGIKLDPYYVTWMTNANVQHIEMRQTGEGVAMMLNAKPMPHISWDDKSLNQAMDLAMAFSPENANLFTTIRKLLPIVSRLGLAVVVRFPLQPGAKEIALAEESVVMAKVNPSKDPASIILKFEVRYDAQGVPSILGVSGYDLDDIGLGLPVAIEMDVLKNLQGKDIQALELRTKPEGLFVYVNNNPLPSFTWDKQLLKNAAEVYAQMNPQHPVVPTVNQMLPMLDTLDIGVMVHFPPAAGAKPIEAVMH